MTHRTACAIGLAFFACGCQVPKGVNMPGGNLKLPPTPPPRANVPLDASLRRNAEAEIAKQFGSGDPVLRANAVEATQKTIGPGGAPRILAALTDGSPVVRFAGAMAAGTLRLEAARDRLLTMTEDESKSVQVAVRYALHRLGDTRLSHDFEVFAKDPEERVRSNVAVALGLLGEPSAMNVLKYMQQDNSPVVRLQVIEAEWRLGDSDARDKLVTGTLSKYADDQIVSILALAAPGKSEKVIHDVMRPLRAQLTSDYEETKLAAARAVGQLGSDDGMAIALKNADSRDVRQRSMAALALGDIGRSDAQDKLRNLLNDRDSGVQLAAATAILQLKN